MSVFQDIPYDRFTVAQLKEIIGYYGYPIATRSNKTIMIEKLRTYLNRHKPIHNVHQYLKVYFSKTEKKEKFIEETIEGYPKEDQPVYFSKDHFDFIPPKIIDYLLQERDIKKPSVGAMKLYEVLKTLEEVDPNIFLSIDEINLEKEYDELLHPRCHTKLFVKGARLGFDMRLIEDYTHAAILDLLKLWNHLAVPKNAPTDASDAFKVENKLRMIGTTKIRHFRECMDVILNVTKVGILRTSLIDDLFKYPPTISSTHFKSLLKCNLSKLDVLFVNYVRSHSFPLKKEKVFPLDKIFIMSRGYHYPLERKELGEVEMMLHRMNVQQMNLLYHIYKVQKYYDPDHEMWISRNQHTYKTLETYVEYIHSPVEFSKKIGILLPYLDTDEERWNYIASNIHFYCKLEERKPINIRSFVDLNNLTYLTDQEIMYYIGAFLAYGSREELLKRVIAYVTSSEKQFFIPSPLMYAKSLNRVTPILLMPVHEVKEYVSTYVAYGTKSHFHVFDVEELGHSFVIFGNRMNFRIPNRPEYTYEGMDIKILLSLLKNYQYTYSVTIFDSFIKHLEKGLFLNKSEAKNDYQKIMVSHYRSLKKTENDEKNMRELFLKIFECGMYMRRWKGPGHPYPIFEHETRDEKVLTNIFDPREKTEVCLVEIRQLLDSLTFPAKDFMEKLRILNWMEVDNVTETLVHILKKIGHDDENFCIRVYSSILVDTGYHYLLLFFGEKIPNVNVHQVMVVQ